MDLTSTMISDESDKKLKSIPDGPNKLDAKSKPSSDRIDTKSTWVRKSMGGSDSEWTTSDQWKMKTISGEDFIDFECRNSVREEIMKELKNDEINMIGVHGTGGVGKTALVKEVDRQAKLCGLFKEVVMVSLSQYSHKREIQQKIGKALGLELEALDTIQREDVLSKAIKNKDKILIILDNIWERLKPSKIGIPHGEEHEGCKILFTTRSQMVCHDMPKKSKTIHLDILMDKDAWQLFSRHAGILMNYLPIQDVVRNVVKECGGIPLALVILEKALSDKCLGKWKEAAKKLKTFEPKTIAGINARLFSCLELSYDYLENKEIKQLFLLCSLFPEEFEIPIEKLIMYGIGEGLFEDASSYEEARDTALGMITRLKDSCLLLPGNISNHVRMHHAVRDCAVLLMSRCSQNDSYHHLRHLVPTVRASEGLKLWPKRGMALENCTYVSLMGNDIRRLPSGLEYPQLQILLLQHNHNLREIPHDFFQGLTSLRVLDLSACFPPFDDASDQQLHSAPGSLLQPLKELRTLCLDQYLRGPLPELGDLQNLMILTLSGSKFITELPREIGQLKNLLKLDFSFCPHMETVHSKTLANLVLLEYLYMHCSFRGWWKEGQEVEEEIHGAANISFLEVTDLPHLKELKVELPEAQHIPEEVSTAKCWNVFCIFIGSEHVRDLKLPKNLNSKALILNVSINTFPAWFNKVVVEQLETLIYFECMELRDLDEDFDQSKVSLIKDLRYLCIRDCHQMEHIINTHNWSSEKRFFLDSFNELHLQSLPSLVNICLGQLQWGFFNKLQVLEVEDCENLTDILSPSDPLEGSAGSLILGNLRTLIVRRCHNLRFILPLSVVRGLLQLEYLLVEDCEELEEIVMKDKHLQLNTLYNLTNVIPKGFSLQVPTFNTLDVERCPFVENFKIYKDVEDEDEDNKSISQHSSSGDKEAEGKDNKEDKPTSNTEHSEPKDSSDEVREESGSYSPYLNKAMLPEDCMKWSSCVVNTPLLKNIFNHVSYQARLDEPPVALKLHGGWKQAYNWGKKLMEIPAAAVLIEKAGFKYFLSIKPRNANRQHLSALMERWWADTNTFHFPQLEMGITPSEFCFYTGLRVGGKPMPWNKHFGPDDLAEVAFLLNREPDAVTSYMNVPCSWLLDNFGNIDLRVAPELVESTVRAFLLYLLGQTLFSNANGFVNLSLLIPLRNLETAGEYDWGAAAMAYLFQHMRFFTRVHTPLKGFWQVLEGWSHDYLGVCRPVNVYQGDIFPRLRQWEVKQDTRGGIHHSFDFVRSQLEHLTADKVHWSPFRESMFYANNGMINLARSLDRKRVLLVGPGCRTSYLGDHCWMQIHGGCRPFVPAKPPTLMGREHELPESVVTSFIEFGGVDASEFIDPNADYDSYWAENSVGFLLPSEFHDPTTHGGVTYKLEARRAESVQASSPPRSHDYEAGPSMFTPSWRRTSSIPVFPGFQDWSVDLPDISTKLRGSQIPYQNDQNISSLSLPEFIPQEARSYLEESLRTIDGMRAHSIEYFNEIQNLRQKLLDQERQLNLLRIGDPWNPHKIYK
ncbi:hypothetical protein NE237_028757 [Protea cynaroides]|uniref:NB-ARC domain-containing protein n=1 Tax=Protea cynaroides TaxID=273540 RepID=A0A9Q0GT10_9MAGN|nr:hypothetical protein NE237_028757 [Protea cynaroides]